VNTAIAINILHNDGYRKGRNDPFGSKSYLHIVADVLGEETNQDILHDAIDTNKMLSIDVKASELAFVEMAVRSRTILFVEKNKYIHCKHDLYICVSVYSSFNPDSLRS